MKNVCLFLIFTAMIFSPVLAEVGYPWSADKNIPQGSAESLSEIDSLYVFIVPTGTDPNANADLWKQIDSKVKTKLQKAGLEINKVLYFGLSVRPALSVTEIRIEIDLLKMPEINRCVFNIRSSLARPVSLSPGKTISAQVWQTKAPLQVIAEKKMADALATVVLEQVDEFIKARNKAEKSEKTEALKVSATSSTQAKVVMPEISASRQYFAASKNSKVFHKSDCSSAKNIKPENLVRYKTRAQALSDSKRPCKICKP